MYIPVKAVKETAAVGVRVHSLLVGFLRPFFFCCFLAWLDICILLLLHFCPGSIAATVRTPWWWDHFCACCLFCDLRAGTTMSLCVESSCSVRMFLALTESSTYRISACAGFSVCRIFVICAPVLLHFLSLCLILQGKGGDFWGRTNVFSKVLCWCFNLLRNWA